MSNKDKEINTDDIAEQWVKIVLQTLQKDNQTLLMITDKKEEDE